MTFEPIVLKLLDNEYNITGYDTNFFIAQLLELNLSTTLPSLLYIDFDGFSLFIEGPILIEDLSLDKTPFLTSEVQLLQFQRKVHTHVSCLFRSRYSRAELSLVGSWKRSEVRHADIKVGTEGIR